MSIKQKTGYIIDQYYEDTTLWVVFTGLLPIHRALWVPDDIDVTEILGNELLVNYRYDAETKELLGYDRDFGEYP